MDHQASQSGRRSGANGTPTISALVTSFDSERRIEECLRSLLWCDELLLVDSFSTDDTVNIAQSVTQGMVGTRIVQHEYLGAAAQKNWALPQLDGDWVLIFDSDEVCTPELRDEILAIVRGDQGEANAYNIHRKTYFLGKHIRYSGWQNDKVARLFRRGTARYPNRRVHARLITDGPAPLLRNSMVHYMVDSMSEYVARTLKYSRWGAAQAFRDDKKVGPIALLVRPSYRFIRTYLLQLGFLDGLHGLAFCMLQAAGSFCKWATLWGWRVNEQRGATLDLPKFEDGFGERSNNDPATTSWEPNTSPRIEQPAASPRSGTN